MTSNTNTAAMETTTISDLLPWQQTSYTDQFLNGFVIWFIFVLVYGSMWSVVSELVDGSMWSVVS